MEVGNIIEALLFAADSPLRREQLIELFREEVFEEFPPLDEAALDSTLAALEEKYRNPAFVYELRRIDGGYQLFTKADYHPYLRQAALLKNQKKLSRASLETLSIIAYKQPVSKPEVEFIRGVNCDYAMRRLLDRGLVEIRGRSEAAGRPLLYGTTPFFMEHFGLDSLKDLPRLEEVAVDEQEYQAQFKVYLGDSPDEAPHLFDTPDHREEE